MRGNMVKNFFGKVLGGVIRHKALSIALAVIVVLAAAAFIFIPRMQKPEERAFSSGQQNTVELTKMDLTSSVSATGTIGSAKTKLVSAQLSNVEIKSVKVSEGDEVKKGQTLLTFDKTDLQNTLSEAKENLSEVTAQAASELSSAKRRLSEAEATYRSQKSRLAKSVATAKKNYQSAKKAVSAAKSQAEKEKAQSALSQAKSAYEQAVSEQENTNRQNKSSVQSAKDSVATAQSNSKKSIREAKRSVTDASEALEECSVTAPMSGTVTAVGVEAGDTYNGGDVIEISDCTNLQVSTTVGEYDISNVKKGQKVVILTDATGEEELEGKITYVAMTTGSSSLGTGSDNNATGTSSMSAGGSTAASSGSDSGYAVRIKIAKADEKLRIGMTAKCSIILKEAGDVYAVPYDAIHTSEDGKQVIYVADNSGKREVEVAKGMESDYYVEISGENLTEGMRVLIPSDSTEADSNSEATEGSKASRDSKDSGFPNLGGMSQGGKSDMGDRGPGSRSSGSGSDGGGFNGGGPGR